MAQVKVTIFDDNGKEINSHFYDLGNNLTQLNSMEREVESLRPNILGDITHDLLQKAQDEDKKKELGVEDSNR